MCFWVPSSGPVGIGVSVVSYAGDVVLGLVVDDGIVSDALALARAIEAELDQLVGPERGTFRRSGLQVSPAAPAL